MKKIDPKVDEAIQTLNMKDGPSRRKLLTGTGLVSATAAASALLAACSSSSSASSSTGRSTASAAAAVAIGNFPKTPAVEVLVRQPRHHERVLHPDPVRLQRRGGAARPAQAQVGRLAQLDPVRDGHVPADRDLPPRRPGSRCAAISADTAFTTPVSTRDERRHPGGQLQRGRPIYNNGVPTIGTNRLAYVGQALYMSGQPMGEQIKSLVPSAGNIVIFIATPGTGNIQPRYDGAKAALGSATRSTRWDHRRDDATRGPGREGLPARAQGHLKGAFAVDCGSTAPARPAAAERRRLADPGGRVRH